MCRSLGAVEPIADSLRGGIDQRLEVLLSIAGDKQNLGLAFSFNGIGVPAATTGLVSPVWAMVAMIASVTAVLANSFGGKLLRGEPITGGFGQFGGHERVHGGRSP